MAKKNRPIPEINASSMADIAFLLLIFFLVTTTIASDRGLTMLLPPKLKDKTTQEIHDKNVFKVLVNSKNMLLVEDEPMNISQIRAKAVEFITNNGRNPKLSENPIKGVVSIKTDRGTKYAVYLMVLDEIKGAYHEVRAKYIGISVEDYLAYTDKKATPALRKRYEEAKKMFPMNISEAESTNIGG